MTATAALEFVDRIHAMFEQAGSFELNETFRVGSPRALNQIRERMRIAIRRALRAQKRIAIANLAPLRDQFPVTLVLEEGALRRSDFDRIARVAHEATIRELRMAFLRYGTRAANVGATNAAADISLTTAFDVANFNAAAYLQSYAADLVTGIGETTREGLRDLLLRGASEGWSYRRMADAIASDFAFSDSRALTIARTETANAYAEGSMQTARRVADSGLTVEKEWLVNDPEDEPCISNGEAGWIPLADPFPSGDDRPPVHPNCECDVAFRVVV